MSITEGILLGMGNPLLDISAVVKTDMLSKYNLKENDAILYEKEDIFEELTKDYSVEYIAGGATQNTIRVAQWILGKATKATSYFGCVGTDETAKTLEERARGDGVDVRYQKKSEFPTGRCAVLVTNHNRSLVTKLDAANHFDLSHLDDASNWAVVEKAKIFYSAGFFLTVSTESMLRVAKHAAANDKIFSMNLSAPFLAEFFSDQLLSVLEWTDLLFGNETEATAFAAKNNYGTEDVTEIAKKLAAHKMATTGRKRTVVLTQGPGPVVVVEGAGAEPQTFEVPPLDSTLMVDTNGAGDAFVGGYLAQLAKGASLSDRVRCGIWAARTIIQRSGCTFPEKMDF